MVFVALFLLLSIKNKSHTKTVKWINNYSRDSKKLYNIVKNFFCIVEHNIFSFFIFFGYFIKIQMSHKIIDI